MTKRYIPISNDQMFKHVFGRNAELCRRLIELALEVPIEKLSSSLRSDNHVMLGVPAVHISTYWLQRVMAS